MRAPSSAAISTVACASASACLVAVSFLAGLIDEWGLGAPHVVSPDVGTVPVLRDLLPTIATPTKVVAGRDDDLVPWSNNQYLHDLLPNSEIHPLDAGHFAWEQAAEEYGRLVVDWVAADIGASERASRTEKERAASSTGWVWPSVTIAAEPIRPPPAPPLRSSARVGRAR
jgi:hypothetical protein